MATKWWCGYLGEPAVLLEDVDYKIGTDLTYYLKLWLDNYVIEAETKGGRIRASPRVFIITSNYTIADLFQADPVLVEAISRRCHYLRVETVED